MFGANNRVMEKQSQRRSGWGAMTGYGMLVLLMALSFGVGVGAGKNQAHQEGPQLEAVNARLVKVEHVLATDSACAAALIRLSSP